MGNQSICKTMPLKDSIDDGPAPLEFRVMAAAIATHMKTNQVAKCSADKIAIITIDLGREILPVGYERRGSIPGLSLFVSEVAIMRVDYVRAAWQPLTATDLFK